MAIGKELIPYKFNAPSKKPKPIEQKAPSFFERSGKKIKGIGKKVFKGGRAIVRTGVKLGTIGAVGTGLSYLAGASSRRYAKAPKFGEGRNLQDEIIAMSNEY